jgi:hypothetical protein
VQIILVEDRIVQARGERVLWPEGLACKAVPVLGTSLKRGRWLSDADRGKPRILVNETMARRFFRNQDAIGKPLVLGVMDPKQNLNEVVGVVGGVRDLGFDQETESTIYGIATGP